MGVTWLRRALTHLSPLHPRPPLQTTRAPGAVGVCGRVGGSGQRDVTEREGEREVMEMRGKGRRGDGGDKEGEGKGNNEEWNNCLGFVCSVRSNVSLSVS